MYLDEKVSSTRWTCIRLLESSSVSLMCTLLWMLSSYRFFPRPFVALWSPNGWAPSSSEDSEEAALLPPFVDPRPRLHARDEGGRCDIGGLGGSDDKEEWVTSKYVGEE